MQASFTKEWIIDIEEVVMRDNYWESAWIGNMREVV